MQVAALAYTSAMICVVTRGFLNVIDRSVFKKKGADFAQIIFLNAILPFIIASGITYALYSENKIFVYLLDIKVMLNALGAQASATAFSHGFKKMTVRNITASSKAVDLVIPIMIFLINKNFSIEEYLFSFISVAIFIPIFFNINKGIENFCLKSTIFVWAALLFQAAINAMFSTCDMVITLDKFMSFICCVLFWRVIFIFPAVSFKLMDKKNDIYKCDLSLLVLRSLLAFISQATFFFSITRMSSGASWPILNSGPLVSCMIAHFLISENLKKPECLTMILFVPVSIFYIVYTWS